MERLEGTLMSKSVADSVVSQVQRRVLHATRTSVVMLKHVSLV